MRKEIIDFVKSVVNINEILEPVIDFGGLIIEEQQAEFGCAIKNIFAGKDYKTFDICSGADMVGDIYNTQLQSESVGTALLLETLEHLAYPQKAINELYRILKPAGLLILSAPMCWGEHRFPKDYWRFLPDGIELLCRESSFVDLKIETTDSANVPSSIFAIARKVINDS